MPYNPFRQFRPARFFGSDRQGDGLFRQPDSRFRTSHINLEVNKNLLNKVGDIAQARGVSLYGQIRDFIEAGVRDFESDDARNWGGDPQ